MCMYGLFCMTECTKNNCNENYLENRKNCDTKTMQLHMYLLYL